VLNLDLQPVDVNAGACAVYLSQSVGKLEYWTAENSCAIVVAKFTAASVD